MRLQMVITVLTLLPGVAASQTDWEQVRQLRPHQSVTVQLRSGQVLKGKVETSGESGLSLMLKGGGILQASKTDVKRVTRKSRLRGAILGSVIGFGLSAPVGAYAAPYIADWGNPPARVRLEGAVGFGLFFGGVGAGIGALGGKEVTVYRAPRLD